MRVGTWNCRSNIDGKRSALERLSLDVVVIPESAAHATLAGDPGTTHAWTGSYDSKGLGVFAFAPWTIEPIVEAEPLPWCLPLAVHHPDGRSFTLLAVWTVRNRGDGRPSYAGQFEGIIDRWAHEIEHQRVIIAGDLNASFQGPSVEPHRRNIERLASLGARSSFDLAHGPVAPEREPPTLRWIGPGKVPHYYHCDYVIVSAPFAGEVRAAEVGTLGDWVESGLSDHCPVVVEIAEPGVTP